MMDRIKVLVSVIKRRIPIAKDLLCSYIGIARKVLYRPSGERWLVVTTKVVFPKSNECVDRWTVADLVLSSREGRLVNAGRNDIFLEVGSVGRFSFTEGAGVDLDVGMDCELDEAFSDRGCDPGVGKVLDLCEWIFFFGDDGVSIEFGRPFQRTNSLSLPASIALSVGSREATLLSRAASVSASSFSFRFSSFSFQRLFGSVRRSAMKSEKFSSVSSAEAMRSPIWAIAVHCGPDRLQPRTIAGVEGQRGSCWRDRGDSL